MPNLSPAAAQGEQAGTSKKPKLVQIGDSYASLRDIIRIHTSCGFDDHGEPVYRIVFKYYKATDFEEIYNWKGEEAERHRDQEWAELATRLEAVGYELF